MYKLLRATPLVLALALTPLTAIASNHDASSSENRRVQNMEKIDSSISALLTALEHIATTSDHKKLLQQTSKQVKQKRLSASKLQSDGDLEQARTELDSALVSVKRAIATIRHSDTPATTPAADDAISAKQFADMDKINSSIDALLSALQQIGAEKDRTELSNAVTERVAGRRSAAQVHLDQGAGYKARSELDAALEEIKAAISMLRNKETLIRSLNFANKHDEYLYEKDRFETYGMLLKLLTEQIRKPDATTANAIQRFTANAERFDAKAKTLDEAGQHEEAVVTMEEGNKELLKAIRRGGLYVPG